VALSERVQTLINRGLWALSRRGSAQGLFIGVPWNEPNRSIAETKLRAAINLIAAREPRRLSRMRRDLDRILITTVQIARGQFHSPLRMCLLDEDHFCHASTTAEDLALTLVHEATHARLFAVGLGYPPDLRGRIERVCMRQELAFAARLVNAAGHVARLERALMLPDSTWSDAAHEERRMAVIRGWGWPRWIAQALEWAQRRRAA
jgi:hypothetical protein